MHRNTRLSKSLTTIAAASLSLLIGSGLFAVIRDTADAPGNRVTTAAFTGNSYLEIAHPTQRNTCSGELTWSPGPSFAMAIRDLDLGTGDFGAPTRQVCVRYRNAEFANARVLVRMTNVVESDFECSSGGAYPESAVDNTCGGQRFSELSQLVKVRLHSSTADTGYQSLWNWKSDRIVRTLGPIEQNLARLFTLTLQMDDLATIEQRQAAQSDRVQWDVRFELDSQ